jgi:glycosyltransferase involved in cell wall biosynthesis
MAIDRALRIAQVAPPLERVPPHAYGGTERVMHGLIEELHARGHEVTTFASADSDVPGRLVPTVAEPLRSSGYTGDPMPYMIETMLKVIEEAGSFDLVHSHLEWASLLLARTLPVPVVSTFHGRLDQPWAPDLFDPPVGGLVAISRSQASAHPEVDWAGIVHNGLDFSRSPADRRRSDDLCFVGRVHAEKGIMEAVEVARLAGRRLRIAAKVGPQPEEADFCRDVFLPAIRDADVEYLGEVSGAERDELFATSYATLIPGAWPEPFGLVTIESLACGTPVLARRVGALPEVIREGVDGFFGDDVQQLAFLVGRVDGLDRAEIARSVRERFSAARMTDRYLEVYERVIAAATPGRIRTLPVDPSRTVRIAPDREPRIVTDPRTDGTDHPAARPDRVERAGRMDPPAVAQPADRIERGSPVVATDRHPVSRPTTNGHTSDAVTAAVPSPERLDQRGRAG